MHIPVTLVAGYLGAGKTTLLNRLLSGDHDRRLAVLVNDFGAVNIDRALIVAHDDQTISLANGCICCAISDDLGTALQLQVERSDRPDHLVIEASGVADAGRLVQLIGNWPGLSLSTVVTLANAATLPGLIADKYVGSLVRRQLRAADLVALTGTDRADPGPARAVAAAHAPDAPVVETPFGAIAPELLLGPDARSRGRKSLEVSALPPRFYAATWKSGGPVSTDAFQAALDRLPPEIHRLKGFLRDPSGMTWLVQRVGRRCTLEAASPAAPVESVIVMIAAGSKTALDEAIWLFDAIR